MARPRAAAADGPRPSLTTIQLENEREKARAGDFLAYLRLNGFVIGSTAQKPEPLRIDPVHWVPDWDGGGGAWPNDIIHAHFADLICRFCGQWHGGLVYGVDKRPGRDAQVYPVRCGWCGAENCAGPLRHSGISQKDIGKTLMIVDHGVAFRLGLWISRGRFPSWAVVGPNIGRAKERLAAIKEVMQRPMHEFVFGKASVPVPKGVEVLRVRSPRGLATIATGYGAISLPNGLHADGLAWDDGCTINTSMVRPSEAQTIRLKLTSTALQGLAPWSVVDILGNVCVQGDANAFVATHAGAHPDEWTRASIFTTGDAEHGFVSPWPERHSPAMLLRMYETDPREFCRTMMGQAVTPDEILYRDISFWVRPKWGTRDFGDEMVAYLGGKNYPVLYGEPKEFRGPKLIAVDLGFTGAEGRTQRELHGRSMTGIVVLGRDAETARLFVLYAAEDYIHPKDHLARILALAEGYGTKDVVIEAGGPQDGVIAPFERAGLHVYTYNPGAKELGGRQAKELRKYPLVDWVNSGRVLLAGYATFSRIEGTQKSEFRVFPLSAQLPLYTALREYPLRQSDVHDALEIGCRKMHELYGLFAPEAEAVTATAESRWGWTRPDGDWQPREDDAERLAERVYPPVSDLELSAV
jgi:hypothetical protein